MNYNCCMVSQHGLKLFVIVLALLGLFPATAEARKLRVGVFPAAPLVIPSDPQPSGLFIDLLGNFAREQDWQIEYVQEPWAVLLRRLEDGTLDLLPAVGYTEARSAIFDFNQQPIFMDSGVIYTNPNFIPHTVFDMAGKRVAAVRGSQFTAGFSQYIASFQVDCELVLLEDNRQVMQAISSRSVDAGVCIYSLGTALAREFDVKLTAISFSPIALHFAVPKGQNQDVIQGIDRLMAFMSGQPDSAYNQAFKKWILPAANNEIPLWLQIGLGVLLSGLGISAVFVFLLRRQVERRTKELRLLLDLLNATTEDLKQTQATALLASWSFELNTQVFSYSDAFYDIFGLDGSWGRLSPDDLALRVLHPEDRTAFEEFKQQLLRDVHSQNFEYRIRHSDGSIHYHFLKVSRIEKDEQGQIWRISGYVQDVTERRKNQLLLQGSYQKSETLLRELYHRTKNNMAIITGLLTLTGERSDQPVVSETFRDMVSRIQSLSILQTILLNTAELDQIDLADFLGQVAKQDQFSLSRQGQAIAKRLDNKPCLVSLDIASPLGLVINELLINACKHAFSQASGSLIQPPEISLSIMDHPTELECRFADNGVGLPSDFQSADWGMGMQLMQQIISRQLQGRFEFYSSRGLVINIMLPKERVPKT